MVGGNAVQRFSQTSAIALPVTGATEFRVPQEPKRTDFFATIQAGQGELSSTWIYRRRDPTKVVSGTIMEQRPPQINHRFCYHLPTFEG